MRGLRTLADVRNRMDGIVLSAAQEIGLEYYADLQRRMPRSEAGQIFERIKAAGKPQLWAVQRATLFSATPASYSPTA